MELFEIKGKRDAPIVVSVPHNGTWIPGEIRRQLAVRVEEVREKVDDYADLLAEMAEEFAAVVKANVSRAVVDLNRSGTVAELDLECDPEREGERLVRLFDVEGRLLWKAPIGRPPISRSELERRIAQYHEPYHAALQGCLKRNETPRILVDMHSMSDPACDLVIGDFRGRSTGGDICERRLKPFFSERGYRVGYAGPRNFDHQGRPATAAAIRYSGGFITSRYGDPENGQYAFQIEVNRENCRQRFGKMRDDFGLFFGFLAKMLEEKREFFGPLK
jgi:N-formylglutamate deformylase